MARARIIVRACQQPVSCTSSGWEAKGAKLYPIHGLTLLSFENQALLGTA